jgi:hypothetical protein
LIVEPALIEQVARALFLAQREPNFMPTAVELAGERPEHVNVCGVKDVYKHAHEKSRAKTEDVLPEGPSHKRA